MKKASLLSIAGFTLAMALNPAFAAGTDNPPGTPVTALPYTDSGNTTGFNNTYGTYGGICFDNLPFTYGGPDAFYAVPLNAGASYTFSMDLAGSTGDLALFLLSDSANPASCVANSQDAIGPGGGPEVMPFSPTTTGEYYVVIDSYYSSGSASAGTYTLSITCDSGPCAVGPSADLAITKTDGVTSVTAGGSTTYTIVASNNGPAAVTGATVTDTFPAGLTCTWTCAAPLDQRAPSRSSLLPAGVLPSCAASGSGNISDLVNLPNGTSVTYTVNCSISAGATGTIANTATIAVPAGTTDPNAGNNSATDTNTVVQPPGVLTISPTAVDFGTVGIGSTSAAQTVTLGNSGAGALSVTTLSAAAAPFAITGGTCGATPIAIAAGANCTLTYTFTPAAAGAATQTLNVDAGAAGSGTIALSGAGGAGVIGVLSANVTFGSATVGSSTQRPLTITNTGDGPLQVTALSAVVAPFAQVAGGTCGAVPFTVAAGTSCTVLFSYSPAAAGSSSQVVTVTADVGTASATLTGTGVVPIALPVSGWLASSLLLLLLGMGGFVALRRQA